MNILELIGRGENAKVDFKRKWYWDYNDPKHIIKLKYAELVKDIFALTNGDIYSINDMAYLIIGIDDETRQVCDFDFPKDYKSNYKSEEKLKQDLLNKLNTYASPKFVALDVNYHNLEEKTIIVISIPPRGKLIALSKNLKYKKNGKTQTDSKETIYYRIGEANQVASEDIIESFEKAYSINGQTLAFLSEQKLVLEEKIKSQNLDSKTEEKVKVAIKELHFSDAIDSLDNYLQNVDMTHNDIYKAHYLKAITYIQMLQYREAKEEIEYIPYKKLIDFGRLNDYAQIYRLNGKYNDAVEIYDFMSSTLQEYLNPIQFAMLYSNIAEISEKIGEFGNTEKYYRSALENLEKNLESDDERIAIVCNNLGSLFSTLSRYDEAEEYLQRSLDIQYKQHGDEHIETISSYNNLATLYTQKNEYDKAEILFLKSLKLSLEILGEMHPRTAIAYGNLAELYRKKGNYDFKKIEDLYNKSIEILKKLHGDNHDSIAGAYNNKGELYRDNDNSRNAIEYYKKALTIYDEIFDNEKHPDIAAVYNNMGLAYDSLGQYILAIQYLERALQIRISVYGENNFDVGGSHLNLSTVYLRLNNKNKSYYHIKRTVEIWEVILPSTYSYLVEAKKRLITLE